MCRYSYAFARTVEVPSNISVFETLLSEALEIIAKLCVAGLKLKNRSMKHVIAVLQEVSSCNNGVLLDIELGHLGDEAFDVALVDGPFLRKLGLRVFKQTVAFKERLVELRNVTATLVAAIPKTSPEL